MCGLITHLPRGSEHLKSCYRQSYGRGHTRKQVWVLVCGYFNSSQKNKQVSTPKSLVLNQWKRAALYMVTFTSFFPLTERLCWVFVAVPGFFSSCGERGLLSSCGAGVSHCSDFFCRRAWALECSGFSSSSTQGQSLRRWDLIGPRYVGSSWSRDQTCVPSIDRWIFIHWITREASPHLLKWDYPLCLILRFTFVFISSILKKKKERKKASIEKSFRPRVTNSNVYRGQTVMDTNR